MGLTIILGMTSLVNTPSANANVTWSQTSIFDARYDGKVYNSQYDITFSSVYIFDNETDSIYFYITFKELPQVDMFNDGLGSRSGVLLDYDLDGNYDMLLELQDLTLKTDLSSVTKNAYDLRTRTWTSCPVRIFTNLNEGSKWIGFKVSRICIGLPNTFDMTGFASYKSSINDDSFDLAPWPMMRVNLLGSSSSGSGSTGNASSGLTFVLPENIANSSKSTNNFSEPPKDLTKLSEELLPSVVTVRCAEGAGTGWSAEVKLSTALVSAGFNSLIVTNHHVIEKCLSSKNVILVLSNGTSVAGNVVSWNSSNDVAGVATRTQIPTLQWIGGPPQQGWWIGVLGSPLGKANVLTTGIVSSINSLARTFTLTAPINPGNSGGPVFDSTGRVLGLATSKNLLSSGVLSEGFGNAHGVPLLCSTIISCRIEENPWGAASKFSTTSNAEVQAEDKAKAEAEADKKLKEEMRNRCVKFNGDLQLAIFEAKTAGVTYPASASTFNGIVSIAPSAMDCNVNASTFDSELQSNRRILATLEAAITKAVATAQANSLEKRKNITCIKGKLTKKVRGTNPKCPKGFKRVF